MSYSLFAHEWCAQKRLVLSASGQRRGKKQFSFLVSGSWFLVSGFVFLGVGFRVSGFGFRILGF